MWKKLFAALCVAALATGPVFFFLFAIFTNIDLENTAPSGGWRHSPGTIVIFWPIVGGFFLALLLRAFPYTRKHFSVTRKEASPMYGLGVMLIALGIGFSMLLGIVTSGFQGSTALSFVLYSGMLLLLFGLSYVGAVIGMGPALKIE